MHLPVARGRQLTLFNIDACVLRIIATCAQINADAGVNAGVASGGITDLEHVAADQDVALAVQWIAVVQPLVVQLGAAGRLAGEADSVAGLAVVLLRLDVDAFANRRRRLWCIAAHIDLDVFLIGIVLVLRLAAVASLVGFARRFEDQAIAIGAHVAIRLAIDARPGDSRCGIALDLAANLVRLILLKGHRAGQIDDLRGRALRLI